MPRIVVEPPQPDASDPRDRGGAARAGAARDADLGGAREIIAAEGGPLIDLLDDHGSAIPFSCRGANCGTCRVVVLEGASELAPPERDELDLLALFAAPPSHRLACQARTKPGLATLRLRPVRDDE